MNGVSIPLAVLCVRAWPDLPIGRVIGGITLATLVLSTALYFPLVLARLVNKPQRLL